MQKPPILSNHSNDKPIGESYYDDGMLRIRLNEEGLKLMEQIKNQAMREPCEEQPADWVGLTDEEVMQTMHEEWLTMVDFARLIEAKLREKNGF